MFRRFSLGMGHRAVVLIGLSLVVVQGTTVMAQDHRNATSAHGMVVSISVEASDVGAKILEQGGNAVDAAIATAFALAVTYPSAGNIGVVGSCWSILATAVRQLSSTIAKKRHLVQRRRCFSMSRVIMLMAAAGRIICM